MKRIVSLFIVALMLLCTFSIPAYALEFDSNTYQEMANTSTNYDVEAGTARIYMHDIADKFTDAEEQEIIDTITPIVKNEDVHVFFVTCDVNHNKTALDFMEEYVLTVHSYYENNIIFGLNMATRDVSISSMGNYLDALGSISIDTCIDKGVDDLSAGYYADGMRKIARQATDWIINDPDYVGATIDTPGQPAKYTTWDFVCDNWHIMTIVSAVITAIVGFILLANHKSANKQIASQTYLKDEGYYKVIDKDETFVNSYTTVQRGYYKKSSSSGGSSSRGGSSHRSSSGRSSGGSRKF